MSRDERGRGDDASAAADRRRDVEELLEATGFDENESVLTRRQAEVLALRERETSQAEIADLLGTSRANVSGIESSARRNVEHARETVAFAEALAAPVRVAIDPGTDLYDVPDLVYEACDEAGVKVGPSAAELMRRVSEMDDVVADEEVTRPVLVGVAADGSVRVRRSDS